MSDLQNAAPGPVKLWSPFDALEFIKTDPRVTFAFHMGWWLVFDGRVIYDTKLVAIPEDLTPHAPPEHVLQDVATLFHRELQIAVLENQIALLTRHDS